MKSTFGSRLRRARLAQNLGSRELARKANLKEGHVSMLEGRDGDASRATAEKLAKALGIDASWLMFGTGQGPATPVTREKRIAPVEPLKSAHVARAPSKTTKKIDG